MLTHIEEYFNKEIPPADLCIVGAGAAGLELANYFKNSNLSITLIEGGYEVYNGEVQKLGKFEQVGHMIPTSDRSKPFGLESAKKNEALLRQYGGTINIWAGIWQILTPFDLLPKKYADAKAWPLSYEELYTYYLEIAKDYGIEELLEFTENPSKLSKTITNCPAFTPNLSLRERSASNIVEKTQEEIKSSTSLRLILGANASELFLTEDLKHVDHLKVYSLTGAAWNVRAKYFILACGTIENTRIMLASNRQMKHGVGNERGLVGKYLMSRPRGHFGVFFPYSENSKIREANALPRYDKYLRIDIALHPEFLTKWDLPNHILQLFPEFDGARCEKCRVELILEQLPNPESRIYLSEECNALKQCKACLDWKFSEMDRIRFISFSEKVKAILSVMDLGVLSTFENGFDVRFVEDATTLLGTTRMATNPEEGVVDPNCQVFGIDNLYLTGSSVFPTCGNAQPVFTILALSRRLGVHIRRSLGNH